MKIAIVIPTYNANKTVTETLISVQKNIQANSNIFIKTFVADDCSKDNTLEVVQNSWHLSPNLIEIIKSSINKGERANFNNTVKCIIDEFDWIYILHADDIAKDNWLKVIYDHSLLYPNIAAISTSYDVLYEDGRIQGGENNDNSSVILGSKASIKNTLKSGTWFHISGCAIKTDTFKKIGYFQEDLPQYGDMEYVLRIFSHQLGILYVPKSLTLYRQVSTSVSANSFKIHRDVLEYTSIIAHLKKYLTYIELKEYNKRFQGYLNKRILKSVATFNLKRLTSALKLKAHIKTLLLNNGEKKISFPFLNNE